MKYPTHLLKLIDVLKRLPGVGAKSAERFAFEMIRWPEHRLIEMAEVLAATSSQLKQCEECGCLSDPGGCQVCLNASQNVESVCVESMCVVATSRDVFSIAATNEYHGLYHVLGALLSPMNGVGPESLNVHRLVQRIQRYQVKEVVIALDSTLEGDATTLYLKKNLEWLKVRISRLAFGLPMGSPLDYVDGGTLARALTARSIL